MPFLDRLHEVQLEPDHFRYRNGEENQLTKILRFKWERENLTYTCDVGTVSDGASIPSILPDIVLNDHGKIRKPAYPHDDIYHAYTRMLPPFLTNWEQVHGVWSKKRADLMFRDAMKDEGMHPARYWLAWAGVRMNLKAAARWGKYR